MFTSSAVHVHPLLVPHLKHIHPINALLAMLHVTGEHDHFHYPPELNTLLEDAAMAREMRRL